MSHSKPVILTHLRFPVGIFGITVWSLIVLVMANVMFRDSFVAKEKRASQLVESHSEDIVIVDCRVGYLTEIDVPALDSGLITDFNAKPNMSLNQGSLIASLDREALLIQRRSAELRRTLLNERLDNRVEADFAETAYEEAKVANEIDEDLYKRNPGAIPNANLRKSRLSLKRAELERERVRKIRREAELELETHLAEIAQIDEALRRRDVSSPSDGVVLSVLHAAGEWVSQGETVARIAPMHQLSVTAIVDESRVSRHRLVGTPVTVRWQTDNQVQTLRGTVSSVDPQILEQRNLRLHVVVENRSIEEGWLLYPGRRVELVLHPQENHSKQDAATARRLQYDRGGTR